MIGIKFCGLTGVDDVDAAAAAGARYIGLVFHPASPRHVTLPQAAALAVTAPPGLARVALTVDADDATLDAIVAAVPLDMLQLHGSETPQRVAQVRACYGLPVIKAVGIATADDLPALDAHAAIADLLLVDARPVAGGLPGGTGLSFDWRLIAGRRWTRPWMLAGGLTPANVAQAIALTGARQVDVSSGIELAPGRKDAARMLAFAAACNTGAAAPAPLESHGPELRSPIS